MGKFIVTSEAEGDLLAIALYIARDNIDAAISHNRRFYEIFQMLADNPAAGRERAEIEAGSRSFPEGSYQIFYRIWAGKVAISRVINAARDLDEIFGKS